MTYGRLKGACRPANSARYVRWCANAPLRGSLKIYWYENSTNSHFIGCLMITDLPEKQTTDAK